MDMLQQTSNKATSEKINNDRINFWVNCSFKEKREIKLNKNMNGKSRLFVKKLYNYMIIMVTIYL